ncbi:MAG: helix-turn-helix domain-containing protein [Lachnospiraceae bacterium]
MTLGDKLSKLRKENNYTQEQLADILGVSRQSISKWESNISYPETDKLIRMSKLFNCSLDYLLKDDDFQEQNSFSGARIRDRKSKKTFCGMPLWHIGRNAKGIIALGFNARGVIAIGLRAKGFLSLGLFSMGFLSFGLFSLGLLSIGLFALGILSAGSLSIGIFSAGAVSLGVISLGAVAAGDFSVGALAIGKYFALGDHAQAMIALGDTQAAGDVFEKIGELTSQDVIAAKKALDSIVPSYLSWAKVILKLFL